MAKFILSKSKIFEQYELVKSFSDIVSYSSKTNPDITPILEEGSDCLFSIHLVNELRNVKDLSRALFLAQGWTKELISDLVSKGVKWFVVDNEVDLDMLLNSGVDLSSLNLMLRLKLKENTIKTEKYYVFGMTSDIVSKRVDELQGKFNSLGIHFHRKSQNMAEWNLQFELDETFSEDFWSKISVVNIGGGLPSVYANTNVKVFQGIYDKIKDLRSWFNSKEVQMMVEPGRFIAAPAGELHTRICFNSREHYHC